MKNYKIKIVHQEKEIEENCNLETFKLNKIEILCFNFCPIFFPFFLGTNEEILNIYIYDQINDKKMSLPNIVLNSNEMYELYNINGKQKLYNHIEELENISIIFDIQIEKEKYYIKKISIIKN